MSTEQSSSLATSLSTAATTSSSLVFHIPLHNKYLNVVINRSFSAEYVPLDLVETIRQHQLRMTSRGIVQSVELKNSLVKECNIQIGDITLNSDDSEIDKKLMAQLPSSPNKTGRLGWSFEGINQFESITIRIENQTWNVEFSRLRRPQHSSSNQAELKTKAHQAIYAKLVAGLIPVAKTSPRNVFVLQGGSGLGKTHCAQHYFYHHDSKQHQIVTWLSGVSEEAFLSDWKNLAQQLRALRSSDSTLSDDAVIKDWCENQLGQWLFIIDEVNVKLDFLNTHLPQLGGNILITTHRPNYQLQANQTTLTFSPLSSEDSREVLQTYLGKHWQPSGFPQEQEAINYLIKALGGNVSALAQMGLLVHKKCISFERLVNQLKEPKVRPYLLNDTVYDQLKNQTYITAVQKGWRQLLEYFNRQYPQLSEEHLKQFINLLLEEITTAPKDTSEYIISNDFVETNWQRVALSLDTTIDLKELELWLHCLPLSYDTTNQKWHLSLLGLTALQLQCNADTPLPTVTLTSAASTAPESSTNLDTTTENPQLPAGADISLRLENSFLQHAEINLLNIEKPSDFKTWRLPTKNPYFIPRPEVTKQLIQKLPTKQKGDKSAQIILAAATGMGGIGKTELARHYITDPTLSSHYQRLFWLTATNASQIQSEFYQLAVFLGLVEAKKYVKDEDLIFYIHRWLSINPGWLMILDNADNYNEIANWIPKEGGSVLVTTREPSPGTLSSDQIVPVPLLSPEEAVTWLYKLSERNETKLSTQEKEAAKELVKELGYLPLAIAQAAAYLREQSNVSIVEYRTNFMALLSDQTLANQKDSSIQKIESDSDSYSRRVIASTWKLSLKAIEEYTTAHNMPNLAEVILTYCSFLAPKDIPIKLINKVLKIHLIHSKTEGQGSLIDYLLDEHIGQLLRYSLLERSSIDHNASKKTISLDLVSIHLLIQTVIRDELKETPNDIWQKRVKETFEGLHLFYSLAAFMYNRGGFFLAYAEMLQKSASVHALAFDSYVTQTNLIINISKRAELLGTLGIIHGRLGIFQESKNLNERALTIIESHYGNDHRMLARALTNLSIDYGYLGNISTQKTLLQRALAITKHNHGEDHCETAIVLNSLGNVYGDLGDISTKKSYLEKALAIQERYYGKDHIKVAITLANLANAYGALGEDALKKSILERVLPIKERHFGKDHYEVAKTLTNLAIAFGSLTDHITQKSLLERALAINESHYGKDHHVVAETLASLGCAYGSLGDLATKKSLLEKALTIKERHYGTDHHRLTGTLTNLGSTYDSLGDDAAAKSYLERALAIKERHYGKDNYELAVILLNLGSVHINLRNFDIAKSFLERALALKERHYGKDHHQITCTLYNLSNVYLSLKQFDSAAQSINRAHEVSLSYYGISHAVTLKILKLSGIIHKQRENSLSFSTQNSAGLTVAEERTCGINDKEKQRNQNEPIELESTASNSSKNDTSSPISLSQSDEKRKLNEYLSKLSNAYETNNIDEALNLFDKHSNIHRQLSRSSKYILLLSSLFTKKANIELSTNNLEQAIQYYEHAIAKHPNSNAYHNLGCCYHIRQNLVDNIKAESCFKEAIKLHPTNPTRYTEYAHFLFSAKRYKEALTQCQFSLDQKEIKESNLSYGTLEAPVIDPAITEIIQKQQTHIKFTAHWLAQYLQLRCYQALEQKDNYEKCLPLLVPIQEYPATIELHQRLLNGNIQAPPHSVAPSRKNSREAQNLSSPSISSHSLKAASHSAKDGALRHHSQTKKSLQDESSHKVRVTKALNDGNCAYNAFALGLCKIVETNQLKSLPTKILISLKATLLLSEETMGEFKKWLSKNKEADSRQRNLAPILRMYTIDYILSHYDPKYKKDYETLLISAYRAFLKNDFDDTFYPHIHIKLQFEKLKSHNLSEDSYKQHLILWWETAGKDKYFRNIKSLDKDIDTTQWDGVLELDILACCIGVNIDWKKSVRAGTTAHLLGIGGGLVNNLELKQIQMLSTLGFGNSYFGKFRIRLFTNKQKLLERMNPLPQKAIILKILSELSSGNALFPDCIDGVSNLLELQQELLERHVITKRDNKYYFITNSDKSIANKQIGLRLNGLSNTSKLKEVLLNHFKENVPEFGIIQKSGNWTYFYRISSFYTKKNSSTVAANTSAERSTEHFASSSQDRSSLISSLQEIQRIRKEAMKSYQSNNFTIALELWLKTLEIAIHIPKEDYLNYHNEIGILHANIGTTYKRIGNHTKAIHHLKVSIAIREEKYGVNCKEAQLSRYKLIQLEHDRKNLTKTRTLSDGNCAYNAFALGLCQLIESDQLSNLPPEVLKSLKTALAISNETISEFKNWLSVNKDNNLRQRSLAPILRTYAINNILDQYDAGYKDNYEALLIGAYIAFSEGDYDDTFYPHTHIKDQFEAVKKMKLPENEFGALLIQWWNKSGKDQYFINVRSLDKSIDTTRWGSEVELDVLASCIGINVCWSKSLQNSTEEQQLGIGGGLIVGLTPKQIQKLSNLGLGATYRGIFRINCFKDKQKLLNRMRQLAEKAIVMRIISAMRDNETLFPDRIDGIDNLTELRRELLERNVISGRDDKYYFITNDDKSIAISQVEKRLSGLKDNSKLREQLLNHFKEQVPKFRVVHEDGHWSYCSKIQNSTAQVISASLSSPSITAAATSTSEISSLATFSATPFWILPSHKTITPSEHFKENSDDLIRNEGYNSMSHLSQD